MSLGGGSRYQATHPSYWAPRSTCAPWCNIMRVTTPVISVPAFSPSSGVCRGRHKVGSWRFGWPRRVAELGCGHVYRAGQSGGCGPRKRMQFTRRVDVVLVKLTVLFDIVMPA